MNNNQPQRPRRDALEDILKEHGFSEFLVNAWGIIELNLNQVVLREHNLSGSNPKADRLIKLSVFKKLGQQLKLSMLSHDEYEIIRVFKERRNKFFHDQGVFVSNLAEVEKQEIVSNALEAVDVTYDLFEGVIDSTNNQRWIDASKNQQESCLREEQTKKALHYAR
jgi:hypothetical protein